MKSAAAVATLALAVSSFQDAAAFSGASSFAGSSVATSCPTSSSSSTLTMEYIPSGMSKEQWRKLKEKEANKNKGKNLGQVGITSFKSRSFADWQKAGGKNLFPVDPNKVKDKSEIPYMQRAGGSVDGDDLKKPKKGNAFGMFGGKKKQPEPEKKAAAPPAQEKKTNWWTL